MTAATPWIFSLLYLLAETNDKVEAKNSNFNSVWKSSWGNDLGNQIA